jgi:hypothetical protein
VRKLLLAALLLLFATPARAGVLTSGTLEVEVGNLAKLTFTASGTLGSAPSNTQVFLASGSAFAGTLTTTLPSSAAPPITGIYFTMGFNEGGSLSGTAPGNVGGEARFPLQVCIESYGGLCILDLSIPFGVSTTVVQPPAYGISITYYARPWTAGTAVVTLVTPTSQGATLTALTTRQGSNGLDALGQGTLVLVSGVNLVTNIAGQIPAFATLTLNFVPEPATGLLLLAAAGGVLALSKRTR